MKPICWVSGGEGTNDRVSGLVKNEFDRSTWCVQSSVLKCLIRSKQIDRSKEWMKRTDRIKLYARTSVEAVQKMLVLAAEYVEFR